MQWRKWFARTNRWLWLFAVLVLLVTVAALVTVYLAHDYGTESLPETLDVVVYQHYDPDNPQRMNRHVLQHAAIRKHMPWVGQIYVLSAEPLPRLSDSHNVVVSELKSWPGNTQRQLDLVVEVIPTIKELKDDFMFLGDNVLPLRHIYRTFMFANEYPRAFNFQWGVHPTFNDTARQQLLEPTKVCAPLKKELLQTGAWDQTVLRHIQERGLRVRHDLVQVFVVQSWLSESALEHAAKHWEDHMALFMSVHVAGADQEHVFQSLWNKYG